MKSELSLRARFIVNALIYTGGMIWFLFDFARQVAWGIPEILALVGLMAALSLGYWYLYAQHVTPREVTIPLGILAGFGFVFYLLTSSPWASLVVAFPGLSGILLPSLRSWRGNFPP